MDTTNIAKYKTIFLSGKHDKKYTLVDEKWYDELSKYKWYPNRLGYIYRCTTSYEKSLKIGSKIFMHRIIMGLSHKDGKCIDHKNHLVFDNRMDNLRICTHGDNMKNKRKYKLEGESKYKGVSFQSDHWAVRIKCDKKTICLGTYITEYAAAKAYDRKAKNLFGEFAKLNLPEDQDYSDLHKYRTSKYKHSPFIGVKLVKKRYGAILYLKNNKSIIIGYFNSALIAAIAHDMYIREHKLNNKLNFPEKKVYDIKYRFIPKVSTSKYKRVCWQNNKKHWICLCKSKINNKIKEIGRFSTEEEAYQAQQKFVMDNIDYKV